MAMLHAAGSAIAPWLALPLGVAVAVRAARCAQGFRPGFATRSS